MITLMTRENRSAVNALSFIIVLLILILFYFGFGLDERTRVSPGMVSIPMTSNHYFTRGKINGVEVTFLFDTGATLVSIPKRLQHKLGLKKERSGLSMTASGLSTIDYTTLAKISIGDISMTNIRANIGEMDHEYILLGMSFLSKTSFSHNPDKKLMLIEAH